MLQKYFSLQVNKQAGGSCENEQTDAGHFQPVGHLPDVCSRFSAPLPCSPCLTAHADIDGNVDLCLSSQTSPSRAYRLAVAFTPKGIPLLVAFSSLHIMMGKNLLQAEADGKQSPTLSLCRWLHNATRVCHRSETWTPRGVLHESAAPGRSTC